MYLPISFCPFYVASTKLKITYEVHISGSHCLSIGQHYLKISLGVEVLIIITWQSYYSI